MTQLIQVEQYSPAIVIATLNRPEKKNALSIALMNELLEVLTTVENDPKARVLLIRGAGDVFCAGLDLDEVANPALAEVSAECIGRVLDRFHNTSLITIALAQGAAIAGGAGLLAASDFAIGTNDIKLGFPEVKRGLVPALISLLLSKQIPWRKLREILLIGNLLTAEEGCQIGLLNRTVAKDVLLTAGIELANQILEGAPQAVKQTKALLNSIQDRNSHSDFAEAHRVHMLVRQSGEAKEGVCAFQEKRPPRWQVSE